MRRALRGVLSPFGKLGERRPACEEQHVAVRGCGEPDSWAQSLEPRGEIRQKQARTVQAVTLTHAQNRVADRFEVQGARLGGEVFD